jgi:hypothetical protein
MALAAGFALLFNATLAATWVWTDLAPPAIRNGAWMVVGFAWIVSAIANVWSLRREGAGEIHPAGDLFPEAMGEYLRGNWVAAEAVLQRILQRQARDVDARLLLATVLRRSGRTTEAGQALAELERYAGVEKWRAEVRREREYLDEANDERATAARSADGGAEGAGGKGGLAHAA